MASELVSVSAVPAAIAGRTCPREGRPRIAAIATDNFALFMLHPIVRLRVSPIRHRYSRTGSCCRCESAALCSNVILLADPRVAQLESDLFLSAHDSVVHWRPRATQLIADGGPGRRPARPLRGRATARNVSIGPVLRGRGAGRPVPRLRGGGCAPSCRT